MADGDEPHATPDDADEQYEEAPPEDDAAPDEGTAAHDADIMTDDAAEAQGGDDAATDAAPNEEDDENVTSNADVGVASAAADAGKAPNADQDDDSAAQVQAGTGEDPDDPMQLPPVGTEVFVGNVPHASSKDEIHAFCETVAPVFKLHVPPPKAQGAHNQGYAFVMYKTRVAAAEAIEQLSGQSMPSGPGRRLNVKYATKKRNKLYVGNIPRDVARQELASTFRSLVPGIMDVDVLPVRDGRPGEVNRGLCFLDFYNEAAAERAMAALQDADLDFGGRKLSPPLRVEWADVKQEGDESEVRSVHVSHLPSEVSEEKLRAAFEALAPIERITLLERRDARPGDPKYRDYAFIHYDKRSTALKVYEACLTDAVRIDGSEVHVAMAKPAMRTEGGDRSGGGSRMDRGGARGGPDYGRPPPRHGGFDPYEGRGGGPYGGPGRDGYERRGPSGRDPYDRRGPRDYDGGGGRPGGPPYRGGYGDDGFGPGYGGRGDDPYGHGFMGRGGPGPRNESWDGVMAQGNSMPAPGMMPMPFMMMPGMVPAQAAMPQGRPGMASNREQPATGGYGAARGGVTRGYGAMGQRYAPY